MFEHIKTTTRLSLSWLIQWARKQVAQPAYPSSWVVGLYPTIIPPSVGEILYDITITKGDTNA